MKLEIAPLPGGPSRRPIRLRSARDARRLIARLIDDAITGQMDAGKAARVTFMANVWIRSWEADELERRIDELEKKGRGDAAN